MAGRALTHIQDLAQAAVLAAMAAQNAAPRPGPFARSPAWAHANVLDYTTTTEAKILAKAAEALPTEFTAEQPNVRVILNKLTAQAKPYELDNVFAIAHNDQSINLLSDAIKTTIDYLSGRSHQLHGQAREREQAEETKGP